MTSKSSTTGELPLYIPPKPQVWKPAKYQDTAVEWLLEREAAALFLDPGLGKTSITLEAVRRTIDEGPVLVFAPLFVATTVWNSEWPNSELRKWKNFKDLKSLVLHGKDKAKHVVEGDADLFVINYDGIPWLLESGALKVLFQRFKKLRLVMDELSKLKHSNTKRFKQLRPWFPRFRRRWGLTGSPAANGLLDLFGQMYAVDLGKSLGPFITHYRTKYFVPSGYMGYQWTPMEDSEDRIFKAISSTALSMKAEDHLDLPSLVIDNIFVDLDDKARKIYDEFEDELMALIDGHEVTASNAGVASMKCRQIASGAVYSGDGAQRKVIDVHDLKLEALQNLIDELQGQPLIIAYEFNTDLEKLKKLLGKKLAVIGGGLTPETIQDTLRAWGDGTIDYLAIQPAAGAHGLDGLQRRGSHLAWYTLTWNYEHYDQLIRRLRRRGSTASRVVSHHLLARNTLDESVLGVISQKGKRQGALFDALKDLNLRRAKRAKKVYKAR